MGETLGIGLTHYPPLVHLDQNMQGPLKFVLRSPRLTEPGPATDVTEPD